MPSSSTLFKPVLLDRLVQSKVWGGHHLDAMFGIRSPDGEPIGETWELFDRPEAGSRLRSGGTLRELMEFDRRGLLGRDVGGLSGFHFDIEIHLGCGAYVCGEESALIESLEGKRGIPRIRPPFPVTQGYVAAGMGVSLVPLLALVAVRQAVVVRRVEPAPEPRHIWLATRPALRNQPTVLAMVDALRLAAARAGRH